MELKNFWITGTNGAPIANPVATVLLPNSETLASGLVDKDGAALANPFTGSDRGHVQFAAPDGRYDLRIVGGGREYTQRIDFSDGAGGGGGINEAPFDEKLYARKDGEWVEVITDSFSQVISNTTDYALSSTDAGKYIRVGSAEAVEISIAPDATTVQPANAEWHFRALGNVEFVPDEGVTVNAPFGGTLSMQAGMSATLKRVAADEFDLVGQTVASDNSPPAEEIPDIDLGGPLLTAGKSSDEDFGFRTPIYEENDTWGIGSLVPVTVTAAETFTITELVCWVEELGTDDWVQAIRLFSGSEEAPTPPTVNAFNRLHIFNAITHEHIVTLAADSEDAFQTDTGYSSWGWYFYSTSQPDLIFEDGGEYILNFT